jgi:predicted nucleic-acid-binding Zn-ribbon protein
MPEAQAAAPPSSEPTQRVNEAIGRLKERGALKQDTCPQCATFNWEVNFFAIPAAPIIKFDTNAAKTFLREWATTSSSWTYIPVISLACKNCGYTMLHNLRMLGLLRED